MSYITERDTSLEIYNRFKGPKFLQAGSRLRKPLSPHGRHRL